MNCDLAVSRDICLIRQCLGLSTRIEIIVRPMPTQQGLWTLVCAAGIHGEQPSSVKAQGPFYGLAEAQRVVEGVYDSLSLQGYDVSNDPGIWRIHLMGEYRRFTGGVGHCAPCSSRPERE